MFQSKNLKQQQQHMHQKEVNFLGSYNLINYCKG